jgi:colicin import membrane protein
MATLQELTLRLSRDLSAHHQDCLRHLSRLEIERGAALGRLPGASRIVRDHATALAEAEEAREKTVGRAQLELENADRKASAAREAALRAAQRRLAEGDAASLKARQLAEDKARAQLRTDLEKIRKTLGLPDHILARRDAERRFDDLLAAAHAAHLKALQEGKDRQAADVRDALAEEASAARAARDRADAEIRAAQLVAQRAVKAAETMLRTALAEIDGAGAVQEAFDERRTAIEADCRQREAALFARFREAKARLDRAVPYGASAVGRARRRPT